MQARLCPCCGCVRHCQCLSWSLAPGVTLLLWRRTGPPSTKTHVTDALLNELQINIWEDCLNLFWIIMLWFMCLLRFIILDKRKEPWLFFLLESMVSLHELFLFSAHRCWLTRAEYILHNRDFSVNPFEEVLKCFLTRGTKDRRFSLLCLS